MQRLVTRSLLLIIVFIAVPLAVRAAFAYASGWPSSWSTADWSSTGELPRAEASPEAVIRIYAARSGRWKSIFAVHHWIVLKDAGAPAYERFDVVGWGTPVRRNHWAPDARWYSNPPVVVRELRGEMAERLIPKVRDAVEAYEWQARGSYKVWPGPNSNTFVAEVLRRVPELGVEMLPTGIGKDYLGPGLHVGRVPSGTGWQVSIGGFAGAALALKEGIELHVLGATLGIDFDDLSLKLPGLGSIGLRSGPAA